MEGRRARRPALSRPTSRTVRREASSRGGNNRVGIRLTTRLQERLRAVRGGRSVGSRTRMDRWVEGKDDIVYLDNTGWDGSETDNQLRTLVWAGTLRM